MQEPGQRRLSQAAAMCIASGPWVQGAAWARREERVLLAAVPDTPGEQGLQGGRAVDPGGFPEPWNRCRIRLVAATAQHCVNSRAAANKSAWCWHRKQHGNTPEKASVLEARSRGCRTETSRVIRSLADLQRGAKAEH